MKAIRVVRPHEIALVDVPSPRPGPDEALVEVRCIGICGSDRHALLGSHPFVTYPRVLGHELAGVLLAPPDDPTFALRPGDPVVVEPYLNCRLCHMCRAGRPNACLRLAVLGVHVDGGMAERIAVRADKLHRVPDGLSLRDAALAEPLGVGFHAARRGRIHAGQKVLVIGAGPIGQSVLAACRQAGARVAISDLLDPRLAIARRLGAELTLDANDPARLERDVADWSDGLGPDVVVEAVGLPETVLQALRVVRFGGTVALVGMSNLPVELLTRPIMAKELDIHASRNSTDVLDRLLEALRARRIDADAFITHEVPLADVPAIMPDIHEHPAQYLKVIVRV